MAFAGMRDKVVIATKSLMRSAEGIAAYLHCLWYVFGPLPL
jgi:hypothetical protein